MWATATPGYGIPQDDEQAAEWCQKAVRHGNKRPPAPCATWPKQEKEKKPDAEA
ncbi:MAG: hypothetical protein ACLT8E_09705 [Akkermansia sp.]